MKIVLFQPQIPQNAGNIARTCVVTGSSLVLIRPLGFSLSKRHLLRAGLDYWDQLNIEIIDSLDELLESCPSNFYFFSSKTARPYTSVSYKKEDFLIFGSETEGLPKKYCEQWPHRFVTIPMIENARCLNLSNSVAIALYEGLRQQQFNFY